MTVDAKTVEVYVAVGSNVEALKNLRIALAELSKHYRLRISNAYLNKAVGFEGEDFINLVVGFSTADPMQRVVSHLHEAEAACGRPRDAPKWAPRTMDLDLLLYGDAVVNDPGIKVPRADLVKRPYMLKPMAELAPDVRHPINGKPMRELWKEFDDDGHAMTRVEFRID